MKYETNGKIYRKYEDFIYNNLRWMGVNLDSYLYSQTYKIKNTNKYEKKKKLFPNFKK